MVTSVHIAPCRLTSLPLLSCNLVSEGVASTSSSLLLEVTLDRAVGETVQAIATSTRSHRNVTVLAIDGRCNTTGIKLNTIILAAAKHASRAASRISSLAAHDVAQADLPSLPVPQTSTDEQQNNDAEDGGKGNGELLALGHLGVGVLGAGDLLEDERHAGRVVLLVAALDTAKEGDGDVVALEVLSLVGVEGPEAPGGGDFVEGLEPLVVFAGGVEVVETDGDFPGGVVVGFVVVVGIPGDWGEC